MVTTSPLSGVPLWKRGKGQLDCNEAKSSTLYLFPRDLPSTVDYSIRSAFSEDLLSNRCDFPLHPTFRNPEVRTRRQKGSLVSDNFCAGKKKSGWRDLGRRQLRKVRPCPVRPMA